MWCMCVCVRVCVCVCVCVCVAVSLDVDSMHVCMYTCYDNVTSHSIVIQYNISYVHRLFSLYR